MRTLVLGSGGREHALTWKLAQSPSVERVFAAPGNPGIAEVAEIRDVAPTDVERVLEVCRDDGIEMVVIGPERPLIAGVADRLRDADIAVYGPGRNAARIEGSKAFAKQLMVDAEIPTARFQSFTAFEPARDYICSRFAAGFPVVVKASGEASGKGAVVAESEVEAVAAAARMLTQREFGEAGSTIVVEERLTGRELSLLAVCNGADYVLLPSAQDYKAAYDGGRGPNTGGMGAYSPASQLKEAELTELGAQFIRPVLSWMNSDGVPYVGTLYAGLMLCEDGPRALEYNARFGDPETQAILPRIESDFADLLWHAARGEKLLAPKVSNQTCLVVVVAAKGYPGEHDKGIPLPDLRPKEDELIFHAGTKLADGRLVSTGGRVLNLAAMAETTEQAAQKVYARISGLFGEAWHYRTDIGR